MAYADSIRTAVADLNDVATLIEGTLVSSSNYGGTSLGPLTTTSASFGALGSVAVAVTAPSSGRVMLMGTVTCSHSTAGKYIEVIISEDSTSTGSGTQSYYKADTNDTTGYRATIPINYVASPAAGAHTYRILWRTDAATAYCFAATLYAVVLHA